jgi:hypothetical protein
MKNMVNETNGLIAKQKFQLKQAVYTGDMTKVNSIIKGRGFSKAFKMQEKRALNLATTFNKPSIPFKFNKLQSFGNNMSNQLKNLTKFKGKSKERITIQNLMQKKFEADKYIN